MEAQACRRVAAIILVSTFALGVSACGSSGSSAGERAGAEKGLRDIDSFLVETVGTYDRDKAKALESARNARERYESSKVEGVVAVVDLPVDRQLDNLVMEQIPGAVEKSVSPAELQSLATRARSLIKQGLEKLEHR